MTIVLEQEYNEESERALLVELWNQLDTLAKYSPSGVVKQLFKIAIRSIAASPSASLLTLGTIIVSFFVVGACILFADNAQYYVDSLRTDVSLRVFLSDENVDKRLPELAKELEKRPEIESVKSITKSQALEEFRKDLADDASLLEGLEEENPLPASLELRVREDLSSQTTFKELAGEFRALDGVIKVEYSRGLLGRLSDAASTLRAASAFAIVLLLAVAGFVISNTITLALYARRDEIEIMRLVGAATSFIRVPCVIEGLILGVIGSVLSLLLLWGAVLLLDSWVTASPFFSSLSFSVRYLSPYSMALMILAGVGVGFIGSYLAVRRFDEVR